MTASFGPRSIAKLALFLNCNLPAPIRHDIWVDPTPVDSWKGTINQRATPWITTTVIASWWQSNLFACRTINTSRAV